MILQQDYRRVEQVKSELAGQHGKLYKAAEQVVNQRLASPDVELRQEAISAYLHSAHDALAWASVRALFSGRLDNCPDAFLREAVRLIRKSILFNLPRRASHRNNDPSRRMW